LPPVFKLNMQRALASVENLRPRKFFPRLLMIGVSVSITTSSVTAATDAATLRARALEAFAPLPAKMPGADNDTHELVKLGRKLYFDKRLSANQTISCNTCHTLGSSATYHGQSIGAFGKHTERNSPTVLNAGFQFAQFWDGRAADLEAQARVPMLNPDEMGMPAESELLKRLRESSGYRARFARSFPNTPDSFTIENVTRAIAAYERTLITHDRFDDFLKGGDRALSRAERKGLELFLDSGCAKCHNGPGLGGNSFQKIGLKNPYANTNDLGRAKITGNADDRFKFKVPPLRNVVLTAPYFHDGQVATLTEAVRQMAHLQFDRELTRDEAGSIETFLHSLSDKHRALQPRNALLR
jgi:cytochrome c peroxidase